MQTAHPGEEDLAEPPGPPGYPLIGNLPGFAADPLGFLQRCSADYGDVVGLRFPDMPHFYLLAHPDHIEQVLVADSRNFIKSRDTRHALGILGNGLLVSEGEFWRRQRRLAAPAFHRRRIESYGETMVGYGERMLAGWEDGQTRNVHQDMMSLTLEIVAKTLFDADIRHEAAEVGQAMATVMEHFSKQGSSMLLRLVPEAIPTPGRLRFGRAADQLDRVIAAIIDERRSSGADPGDLLSMLLAAEDDEGQGMSDKQLRDEVLTVIGAGHETTAISLSWAWYLLGTHPETLSNLLQELSTVLDGRAPTVDDLPRLPYAAAVIKESMRLYPPVWAIGREAVRDCQVAGYYAPVGTQVLISQWVAHRDPRYFDDPEDFLPSRWLDGSTNGLPDYAYFPFGGGPRMCIGAGFARMGGVLLLATIAQRFRIEPIHSAPPALQHSITLRPKGGLPVRVRRR